MIIRGTTPTISFNIKTDLDLNDIAALWITFKTKPGNIVKEKTYYLDDVEIDAEHDRINLFLSQEETLEFANNPYNIQIRMRMNDDLAYASSIIEEPIGRILKDGVI